MDRGSGKLTVFFEDPFWVGVFERIVDGRLSVAKVTFGAEPKDYEVFDFILRHYYSLKFSPAVAADVKEVKCNPKRMQRDAKKQMQETGIGTKSQQALQLQQEQNKRERKLSVLTHALAILLSACGQKKDLNVMSDQRMVLTAFLHRICEGTEQI